MNYQALVPLLRRPSVFVPLLLFVAAPPAIFVGGCGSSTSNSTNTEQFTSIPSTPVSLTLGWADLVVTPPTPATSPTTSPTSTPTPTSTPNPSATPPFTESTPPASTPALAVPPSALSAVLTLSSADPSNGSVLVLPPINRDDTLFGVYTRTYVSAAKAREGTTNANVRFYDAKNGKGNALADSTKLGLLIKRDGTGLNDLLPPPAPIATPTPSPTPRASP